MAVHGIAYLDLYTRDQASTVDHFLSRMGFARIAESHEDDRTSTLLRQGGV
jgi:4-hydroxymandelate synthase